MFKLKKMKHAKNIVYVAIKKNLEIKMNIIKNKEMMFLRCNVTDILLL